MANKKRAKGTHSDP